MNKTDLLYRVKNSLTEMVSKELTQKIVDSVFREIIKSLIKHESVIFKNFGTFSIKEFEDRNGFNPRTREKIIIKKHNVIKFKPSPYLKKIVN